MLRSSEGENSVRNASARVKVVMSAIVSRDVRFSLLNAEDLPQQAFSAVPSVDKAPPFFSHAGGFTRRRNDVGDTSSEISTT